MNTPAKRSVLISIVTYRTARMVEACIRSLVAERALAASQGIDLTVVVVDNDSGDAPHLESVVAELALSSWVTIHRAEKNGGFAYGNNCAFRWAYESGNVPDYFWMLNPDTEVRPGATEALVSFLDTHPTAGGAGSRLEFESGKVWPHAFRFPSIVDEVDRGLHLGILTRLWKDRVVLRTMGNKAETVDWLPGASMMVRREVVETIGGMDEAYFLYYEETDYSRRMREAGWPIWYVPDSHIMHSAGGSTGVTTAREQARRLPSYWYDSRRRYYLKNHGWAYAVATDIAGAVALTLGNVKRIALGRSGQVVPHQVRDILAHSPLHPKRRELSPVVTYYPPRSTP